MKMQKLKLIAIHTSFKFFSFLWEDLVEDVAKGAFIDSFDHGNIDWRDESWVDLFIGVIIVINS
jgi:hypothetical protein